jgi:FixJ family two-component response regulator
MDVQGPLVYVVDDDDRVRELVARIVRSFGYETETFSSAADFLTAVQSDRTSCLLLDVHLVGGTGFELFAELERRGLELPTVFMTGAGTIPMSVQAMKAGAVEFLTKPIDWGAMRTAVEQALARAQSIAARRATRVELTELLGRLTPREAAVFPYVVRGWLNKQIAAELAIVEQTVKVHRARIMQKLEVESVADLVRLAERFSAAGIDISKGDDTKV